MVKTNYWRSSSIVAGYIITSEFQKVFTKGCYMQYLKDPIFETI